MPHNAHTKVSERIKVIQVILVGILLSLGAKSFDIQIFKAGEYSRRAENGYSRHLTIKGERGQILDRHWNKLGTTLDAVNVTADPLHIEAPVKTARALATVLEIDPGDLAQKFSKDRRYTLVAENISPDLARQVQALNLPGTFFQKSFKRFYPNRDLAAQVIGFTGKNDIGLEGLEFKFNDVLEGRSVRIKVRRDGTGRILDIDRKKQDELRGHAIVLTLDKKIQFLSETVLEETVRKHQAKSGLALVMRTSTGELLAVAQHPRFNPNNYREFDQALFRNRAVTDAFEPGSTMKVFTAAAALENGLTPDSIFFCENGRYRIGRYTIHDTRPHDWLSIDQIITYSSNIGAAKIGEHIGNKVLHHYLVQFGFGGETQVECPGETGGTLMAPEKWSNIDAGAISFGQGISVSAIQLISGISAIANNGQRMKPMLVKKIVSNTGLDLRVFHPTQLHQAISPQTAEQIKHMMNLAVQENGTGTKAALDGYIVCGKTGTAQKVATGQKGYAKNRYTSVFAGFAPRQNPQLAILVVVDEPRNKYSGGDVAAPAFKTILAQSFNYLSIPPAAGSMVAKVSGRIMPAATMLPVPVVSSSMAGPPPRTERRKPVKLSRLMQGITASPVTAQLDTEITGIRTRAQDITPGQLFIAIEGHAADGHDYMTTAFEKGAAAVISQKNSGQLDRVILVDNTRKAAGAIAARFYKDPSRDLTLVGVTGTNGKTTITYLLEYIFMAADCRCGVMGTINIRYNGQTRDNPITTPDAVVIQQNLARMKQAGITHVIMEVSSHGLDQYRVDGCRFDMGIFTNLTQDHLDYHRDMEDYFLCKKRFFTDFLAPSKKSTHPRAVINTDDAWGNRLVDDLDYPLIRVSSGNRADVTAGDIIDTIQGIAGRICIGKKSIPFSSTLTGRFNLGNILCAAGAAYGLGISLSHIQKGLENCTGVPGRLEKVAASINRYIFVDYAHTPDALESVLKTLKQQTSRRLITVFGCGGDRDRSKRPIMGAIACHYSDVAIVTSDNPRAEDPEQIVNDIMAGIKGTGAALVAPPSSTKGEISPETADIKGVIRQVDRKKALYTAIQISRPGDVIVAAGKGHETYQIIRTGTIHFDDREELSAACDIIAGRFAPIPWTGPDLEAALGIPPAVATLDPGASFAGISTDSRTIQADEVFLALTGETFDAHAFIPDLVTRGIQAFVSKACTGTAPAPKTADTVTQPKQLVFDVPETLAALGKLGRHQRLRSGVRVLAITGSNGKTTTRKMAQKIFETTFDTLATQKNFNNEIGVSKTLLSLSDVHQWAVVEMGMNQPSEIKRLSAIACPDIALVTNTASAHLEGLKTFENVARAKSEIFDHAAKNSTAIIFKDDPRAHILETRARNNPDVGQVISFGSSQAADVFATDIQVSDNMTRFLGHIRGETAWFHLHSPVRFMVLNALAALAAATVAGVRIFDMQAGLAAFTPVSGRMNFQVFANGIHLIDDTYNANPASVTLALNTLAEKNDPARQRQTIAILGDMLELGDAGEQQHWEIGRTAAELGISRLYLFGPLGSHTRQGAIENGMPLDAVFHGTKEAIAAHAAVHAASGDWVLVKGSRGMAMETIIQEWEPRLENASRNEKKGD